MDGRQRLAFIAGIAGDSGNQVAEGGDMFGVCVCFHGVSF